MKVRKRKNLNLEDEIIQEAEVITHWSKTRILIALALLLIIIGGGILGVQYFLNNSNRVLGSNIVKDKPNLQVPDQDRVQEIINKAKKDLSDINPKNIVESQPQIQKIINDLNNISGSSNSAKTLICDSLCK